MIKVCHMTSAHDPEDVRIFRKECVSLAKAGYEVYLVERGETYEKDGVHIIGVGQPDRGRLNRMTEFAKKVYEAALAVDADIYHFHDPELLPYGLKLKKKGKKVIFDSHENYSEQMKSKPYLPGWVSTMVAWGYTGFEKYAVKRLDATIYPCTFNGKLLYQGICPRVEVLDNVASLDEMYDRYIERDFQENRPICFVGTLSQARCISEIIQAAGKTGLPLVLAGGFSSQEYQEECLRLMEPYGNIQWIGPVDHAKVPGLLQNASIGLCPEKNILQYNTVDNLATKSYEYMAMGLPVIVSDYSFSRKVMQEYEYGILVDPDDVDDIARAMKFLAENPDEARRMGENGRRAIKERFNWGMEEKKLLALYEDILKE